MSIPSGTRDLIGSARRIPLISEDERGNISPQLLVPVDNRKSGLSLNHIIGCPLNCAYCVRHLFGNFGMKEPHALMSDEDAVVSLIGHRFFRPNTTPVQIFNRATDPFLPVVKKHTFRVLELLARAGLENHVLVITRYEVTPEDAARLNEYRPLRLTILHTYSGITDRKIEPLGSEVAAKSIEETYKVASAYRVILYWRPIILGVNDTDQHIRRAAALSRFAHATVFTGLFYRDPMRTYYQEKGIAEPYKATARRKIFPRELEQRVIPLFGSAGGGALFRKTSCAVSFAHKQPDFNGHFGIRELCDICPQSQVARCAAAFRRPNEEAVKELTHHVGTTQTPEIGDRAITFDSLDEESRYYIQHSLGYQVHDRRHPHFHFQHGRAHIGWESQDDD